MLLYAPTVPVGAVAAGPDVVRLDDTAAPPLGKRLSVVAIGSAASVQLNGAGRWELPPVPDVVLPVTPTGTKRTRKQQNKRDSRTSTNLSDDDEDEEEGEDSSDSSDE